MTVPTLSSLLSSAAQRHSPWLDRAAVTSNMATFRASLLPKTTNFWKASLMAPSFPPALPLPDPWAGSSMTALWMSLRAVLATSSFPRKHLTSPLTLLGEIALNLLRLDSNLCKKATLAFEMSARSPSLLSKSLALTLTVVLPTAKQTIFLRTSSPIVTMTSQQRSSAAPPPTLSSSPPMATEAATPYFTLPPTSRVPSTILLSGTVS
mmetsp:Transcript_14819/g.27472  ORF Transcript_14819/g.27472 Transcript_14819/m.27472 type:complete len:208 (-) Transcript_14819:5218-5841(-)